MNHINPPVLLLVALALLLVAAGIEWWRRRTAQYMPPLPAAKRTDLLFGYYGRDDAQCVETAGAVNLVFELRWDDLAPTIARMQRQALKTVLVVSGECWIDAKTPRPAADAEAALRVTFDALRSAGVLGQVIGLYPIDEPDLWGTADADVVAVCATVRKVAASYPELAGVALVVCYSKSCTYPGASAFDWLSIDDYPEGSNALVGAPMTGLRKILRPGQRLFLVPGGCDPFRNDPEPFRRVAHADPLVVAVVPFCWRDYVDPSGKLQQGIRSNGMAPAYAALGRELTGST